MAALAAAFPVEAEVTVTKSAAAVVVTASDDSVADILAALDQASLAHFATAAPLDKRISGRFSGSLSGVLSQILDGYNYAIVHRPEGAQITIFGAGGNVAEAPAPLAPPPPPAHPLPPPRSLSQPLAATANGGNPAIGVSAAPLHLVPLAPLAAPRRTP